MDRSLVHLIRSAVVLLAVAVLATGCGSDDSPTTDTAATTPSAKTTDGGGSAGSGDGTAELEITMEQVGGKQSPGVPVPSKLRCTKSSPATCSGTLSCPAAEGTNDADGCAWLAEHDLEKIAGTATGNQVCTMIYGGPETVKITGTIGDEAVDASFSRQNGCAIAAWDEAQVLWT